MADALSLIPASVLRNLADKLYEKRKNAALEVFFRYYACEALYNIAKDIVTESDQFSIEEFIPLLRERMNVLNPYVRQFLVGFAIMKNVDYGRMAEILVQRAGSSDEFTRLTAITWVKLITFSTFLMVARETNEELRAIRADPADGFDIDAILSIARRCIF
ncbi:hypothetical protein GW17_00044590 [Ensete ventricosum]|uniref:Uncharacterized protein n=1 Tax=Ensete ventricosum TaxID=4639 RepID=A0A444D4B2_ENSVE|nr:hypothetical protein B296_00020745 [Ensete ventricosum]RWV92985.1 hypothetical protein GW17_00044590 [Ensete ventricosum]